MPNKKLSKKKLLETQGFARALIDPASIDKEARRVSILISTEAPIRKTDWYSGENYDEVLLHGAENIDLTRAATAKLRYMHGSGKYGELPIGRLENVRIENNELRADAIFSAANPDAEMLWQMVLEETLTEISVGGKKVEMRITERDGEPSLVEVTRWEFHEASLVDIGADPAAGIGRSENNTNNLKQGEIMNEIEKLRRALADLQGKKAPTEDIQRAQESLDAEIARVNANSEKVGAENIELKRKQSINSMVALSPGVLSEEEVQRFLDNKTQTEADLARAMLAKKTEKQVDVDFQRGVETPAGFNVLNADKADIARAVSDAVIMRSGVVLQNPDKNAEVFRNASLLDIARAVTGYAGYDNNELVQRSMSTSDFPNLLGNVANRILANEFERTESTYQLWVTQVEVPNFLEQTDVLSDGIGGRFSKVKENGEKKNVEFGDNAEKWKIESFGEEITITREMIINDQFNYFTSIVSGWAEKAKRTVNGHVYDLLQGKGDYAGYVMADGIALFNTADHNNLSAAGAALSDATLSAARVSIKRQKDANGDALNITPKFLFAGAEQENTALKILTSESSLGSSNSGEANIHKGTLTPIFDAELDAAPWFLAANRRTIKVGFLSGTNKMPIVREKKRDLSSLTLECVFDFGVMAESFRGLYKNAGA